MAVVWKLKAFLSENQITPNTLAEHVKGKLSKTAVYNLVGDKQPSGINFATIDILIPALTALTHQSVSLHDLMEYRPSLSSGLDWRSHIGALGKETDDTP